MLLYLLARLGEVRSVCTSIRKPRILTELGTEYNADDVFDLSMMQPYSLDVLYKKFARLTKHIVLYLPRNSDLNQVARYAPESKKIEVAHYCILGASKVSKVPNREFHPCTHLHMQALCVYFGDFDFEGDREELEDGTSSVSKSLISS